MPAWDLLPYDWAQPSPHVRGAREASVASSPTRRTGPGADNPKRYRSAFPWRSGCWNARVHLTVSGELDPKWLRATLEAFGYIVGERVGEPDGAALRRHYR